MFCIILQHFGELEVVHSITVVYYTMSI